MLFDLAEIIEPEIFDDAKLALVGDLGPGGERENANVGEGLAQLSDLCERTDVIRSKLASDAPPSFNTM